MRVLNFLGNFPSKGNIGFGGEERKQQVDCKDWRERDAFPIPSLPSSLSNRESQSQPAS